MRRILGSIVGWVWLGLSTGAILEAQVAAAPRERNPKPVQIKPTVDLRLRGESFSTPVANGAQDSDYGFGIARLRAGLDLAGPRFTFHAMVQGAATSGLPPRAVLGSGPTYRGANAGAGSPSALGIAELSVAWTGTNARLTLGRQGFVEGFEAPTGSDFLDGVKRRRFAERLYGNLDFTNVGRRYDGVTGWVRSAGKTRLDAFVLRPLAGAFDYDDAFDDLGDLHVAGLTLTGPRGAWIPGAEVRLFASRYEDGRRLVPLLFRGRKSLDVTTGGASLLAGNDATDLALWAAVQDKNAGGGSSAFAVDLGHRFAKVPGKPAVHLAFEQASAGGVGETYGGFFNLLPTNHKFYGNLDYFAFSNLRDAYVETTFAPGPKWKVRAALHSFSLVDRKDAWYGGSGAFSASSFGYVARRPRGGVFPSRDLGTELDLDITWTLRPGLDLGFGGGALQTGPAIESVFPARSDGRWLYLEMAWKR